MKKMYLYLALGLPLIGGNALAQKVTPCYTDEMHQHFIEKNPMVAAYEKQLNEGIAAFIAARSSGGGFAAKTTAAHSDTDYYDIPVVVHIIHSYGSEYVKDSNIYVMIDNMNKFFSKQNNLSGIIEPFRMYIGNAKIRFHLVTKDPTGNPTTGITRHLSYLTSGGDEQAKLNQWAPRSYYNIWLENKIGRSAGAGTVLAYSTFPSSAEAFPYSDGVITGYQYINDGNTIEHETGHYFNLLHVWNSSLAGAGVTCGDDEVDDTPPTKGHPSTCNLYDVECATNYFKIYPSASGFVDSLVNYPDTTNTQNVMDYSSCVNNMFTIGQVWRMRAALNNNIGGRNNLWDSTNLLLTGALDAAPDLPPVVDYFSKATILSSAITKFTFPNVSLYFANKSWRDTISSVSWTFSNGANVPAVTYDTYGGIVGSFGNAFSEPGWVQIKLDAEGNHSGVSSATYANAVFVADNEGVDPAAGYIEEFDEKGKRAKWPSFNYYNNGFRWQLADVGMFDNNSIMYQGFDARFGVDLFTGSPLGDYDDLYSVPFNLSGFESRECNLNFHFSGASRTAASESINDTLLIEYSVDKKHSWSTLVSLTKNDLINKGAVTTNYVPSGAADWAAKSINIPSAARKSYVVFRFRYKPGVMKNGVISTGNNYYMDRVHISQWTADVSDVQMGVTDVRVVPNPTRGDAYVLVKDASATHAEISVSDITGKVVYRSSVLLAGNAARVQIPKEFISEAGIYLIQTVTGSQKNTQKLVVY